MGSTDHGSSGQGTESPVQRDIRLESLRHWLMRLTGASHVAVTTASADASFRRYFRVTIGQETRIVMDAPPDKEDVGPFIRVAAMLGTLGVNAPRILESNLDEGFLLMTDLGSQTYLTELEQGLNVESLYQDAIAALVRIQSGGKASGMQLPPYDHALLLREQQLFADWFLVRHLGLKLDASETAQLQRTFSLLCTAALQQPRVFVHRDYHSRNLMICRDARHGDNPGILDFQDAVFGPTTYDLVSLLRDCYVVWPPAQVTAWVETYRHLAQQAGLDTGKDRQTFLRWFDWMGVQRHLKAIGIFARLWHRDGKRGYLNDIPRTMGYVRDVAARYPELSSLERLLAERVEPLLSRSVA